MRIDFEKFYGESNTMDLYVENGVINFKSKRYLNILIFITFLFFLVLPFLFVDIFYPMFFVFLYLFISAIFSLTYQKGIIFNKNENKLIYYRTFFGYKHRKEYDFINIKEIILRTFRAPIIGLQIPLLIKKYRLEILFNDGKHIYIDKSSNFNVIKKYSEVISQVKQVVQR